MDPYLHIYFMTQKPNDKGPINALTSEDCHGPGSIYDSEYNI